MTQNVNFNRINWDIKETNDRKLNSIRETQDGELEMIIYNQIMLSNNKELVSRFKDKFDNKQEYLNFIDKVNTYTIETDGIDQLVEVLLQDTKQLGYQGPSSNETRQNLLDLDKYLRLILKVCSMKGIYAQLNLRFKHSGCANAFLVKIKPFGIYVDKDLAKLSLTLFKKEHEYLFFIEKNNQIESFYSSETSLASSSIENFAKDPKFYLKIFVIFVLFILSLLYFSFFN